jgi:cytochrome c biogenesis protein CcmG, thiol:disulfide interchange protein DsbE
MTVIFKQRSVRRAGGMVASAMLCLLLGAVATMNAQDSFPREELQGLDGSSIRLTADARAKLSVLDFWALWCAPCQQSIPELRDLAGRMESQPVRFYFINCDNTRSRSKARSFSVSKGIDKKVLLDPSQNTMRYYGISSLPHIVILDSLGKVVEREAGYMLGDDKALEKKLLELLGR